MRYLLPLTLCAVLSGCDIYSYPDMQPQQLQPVGGNSETINNYYYKHGHHGKRDMDNLTPAPQPLNPAVQPINPPTQPIAPYHGKGFNPPPKPLEPYHAKGFNTPPKPVKPNKPVEENKDKDKKPALLGE